MKKIKEGLYWHVHHNVLVEYCYDYDNRVRVIKYTKPKNEIKTRLKLLKPVKGKISNEFVEAKERFDKAWERREEAWKRYEKARERHDEAWEGYEKAKERFEKITQWYKNARGRFGKATQGYEKARERYDEAWKRYDEAWCECEKATQGYVKTLKKHQPYLEALHQKECGCKEWNGKEIVFKKGTRIDE